MPLGKGVSKDIQELMADNKRSGKERGANGKKRTKAQIVAIAMRANGKAKKMACGGKASSRKRRKMAKGGPVKGQSHMCRKGY